MDDSSRTMEMMKVLMQHIVATHIMVHDAELHFAQLKELLRNLEAMLPENDVPNAFRDFINDIDTDGV